MKWDHLQCKSKERQASRVLITTGSRQSDQSSQGPAKAFEIWLWSLSFDHHVQLEVEKCPHLSSRYVWVNDQKYATVFRLNVLKRALKSIFTQVDTWWCVKSELPEINDFVPHRISHDSSPFLFHVDFKISKISFRRLLFLQSFCGNEKLTDRSKRKMHLEKFWI